MSPAADHVPVGHSVHVDTAVAPTAALKRPAAHGAQLPCLLSSWYVPAAQAVGWHEPEADQEPAGVSTQAAMVLKEPVDPTGLHSSLPSPLRSGEPAGHGRYFPTGHSAHALAPFGDHVPQRQL